MLVIEHFNPNKEETKQANEANYRAEEKEGEGSHEIVNATSHEFLEYEELSAEEEG